MGMTRTPVIERAFQLADDSHFTTVYEIRLGLMREGYGLVVLAHLDGLSIARQLRERIVERVKRTPDAGQAEPRVDAT